MDRFRLFIPFFACLHIIISGAPAAPEVKVFSYDEALSQNDCSKPRTLITNYSSTQSISNFYYYYYFTVENGKSPVLEDYYTPNSVVSLESTGNGAATMTGCSLRRVHHVLITPSTTARPLSTFSPPNVRATVPMIWERMNLPYIPAPYRNISE